MELPPEPEARADAPTSAEDVDALLRQLGTSSAPATPEPAPPPVAPPPAPPEVSADNLLQLDLASVYEAAGLEDGPNSAGRLLKMLAGLAMFPADQQLAMVRALDAADASWTEGGVLSDARRRQQVLRTHLDRAEREHGRRVAGLTESARAAQTQGDGVVADIDRQIAELQRLRQEALSETANALARLDSERRDLDTALTQVRSGVSEAQVTLSNLIAFFAGQQPPAGHGG